MQLFKRVVKVKKGDAMKMTKMALKERLSGLRELDVVPGIVTRNGKILPHLIMVGRKTQDYDSRKLITMAELEAAKDKWDKTALNDTAKGVMLRSCWMGSIYYNRHPQFKELLDGSVVVMRMPYIQSGHFAGFTADDIDWLEPRIKSFGTIQTIDPKFARGGAQGSGVGKGGRLFISKTDFVSKWYKDIGVDTSLMSPAKIVDRTGRLLGEEGKILEHLKVNFIDKELGGVILTDEIWGKSQGLNTGDKVSGYKVKGSIMLVKNLFAKTRKYLSLPKDTIKLPGLVTEEDLRVVESRSAKGNASWNVGRNPHISFELQSILNFMFINEDRLKWLSDMVAGKCDRVEYVKKIGWIDKTGKGKGYPSKLAPEYKLPKVGALLERLLLVGDSTTNYKKGLTIPDILQRSKGCHEAIMKSLRSDLSEICNPRFPGAYGVIMPWDKDAIGIPKKAMKRNNGIVVVQPVNYPVRFRIIPTEEECIRAPKEFIDAIGKDFDGDQLMIYFLACVSGIPDWSTEKEKILKFLKSISPEKVDDIEDPRSLLEVMKDGVTHYGDIGVMTNRVNICEDIARTKGWTMEQLLTFRMKAFFGVVQPHIDALKYSGGGDLPTETDICLKYGIKTNAKEIEEITSYFGVRKRYGIEAICMMANSGVIPADTKSFYGRMILRFKGIDPIKNTYKAKKD